MTIEAPVSPFSERPSDLDALAWRSFAARSADKLGL
jgi:hypothetical protein